MCPQAGPLKRCISADVSLKMLPVQLGANLNNLQRLRKELENLRTWDIKCSYISCLRSGATLLMKHSRSTDVTMHDIWSFCFKKHLWHQKKREKEKNKTNRKQYGKWSSFQLVFQSKFSHLEYLLVDASEEQDETKPKSLAKVTWKSKNTLCYIKYIKYLI